MSLLDGFVLWAGSLSVLYLGYRGAMWGVDRLHMAALRRENRRLRAQLRGLGYDDREVQRQVETIRRGQTP